MTRMQNRIDQFVQEIGGNARQSARLMATAPTAQKNEALVKAAAILRARVGELLTANASDVAAVEGTKPAAFIDRLRLNEDRVEAMARSLEEIAALPDPVGRVLSERERPNGLRIEQVAVPIGVIAMIYESRPNVGADASALCLKAGNAVILRGGSDSAESSKIISDCMRQGLHGAGLPDNGVQNVWLKDRAVVDALLADIEHVDLAIPRGGRGLVELVRDKAKVPTLLHLDGNCHTYIHAAADQDKAVAIVRNAKLRRTGICGALESILIDRAIAESVLPKLVEAMPECEFRGDVAACAIAPSLVAATEDDWSTEYLDTIASVKLVDDVDDAMAVIDTYGSHHTDAIVTEDQTVADHFLAGVDSAIVMHNASTQFADGGEFGMGAEIGIATGKLHARGPVGLEQLTSSKYRVRGTGQIRP